MAGAGAANHIAQWNGSAWSALGSGLNSSVSALAVSGSTGLFSGSFLANLTMPQPTAVNGVMFQKTNVGVGLFLGPSQAGRVVLTPP